MIDLIKVDDVIYDMNEKDIKPTVLIKETGISSETFYRFVKGENVSKRTIERIVNYINEQP